MDPDYCQGGRTRYVKNDKIRIKTTDRCNMNCWFCHAEGAPRCSDILIDKTLDAALHTFRTVFSKAHLTGGEPFLYPHLEDLLGLLEENGYAVSITTNGCFELSQRITANIKRFQYINFSFHSLEPDYYLKLSHGSNGAQIVDRISSNIRALKSIIPVRINTVVSGNGAEQRLEKMIEFAEDVGCELKFVPELRTKETATYAIESLLEKEEYHLFERLIISPSSNLRERFINSRGSIIEIKKLVACFPFFCCNNCESIDKCQEGFSFVRIGGNPLYTQICIKKQPVLFDEFLLSRWSELKKAFENEIVLL